MPWAWSSEFSSTSCMDLQVHTDHLQTPGSDAGGFLLGNDVIALPGLDPGIVRATQTVGWAKPTGPAGACHRAGQRPDPVGRPDDRLRVPTLAFVGTPRFSPPTG